MESLNCLILFLLWLVGYETRNTDVRQLLHNSDPNSTLFIAENQRFDKDFSVFDKN